MTISKNIAIAILAGASVTLIAGCSVAQKQESAGQYVDGTVITTKIKSRLAEDSLVSATNVSVKTMGDGEVQLSGFTNSQEEKDRAGAIASSVNGVTEVNNDLVVR